jgi:hypothetical protein
MIIVITRWARVMIIVITRWARVMIIVITRWARVRPHRCHVSTGPPMVMMIVITRRHVVRTGSKGQPMMMMIVITRSARGEPGRQPGGRRGRRGR